MSHYKRMSIGELISKKKTYVDALYGIMNRHSRNSSYEKDMRFMLESDGGLSPALMAICTILKEDYLYIFESIATRIHPESDRNNIIYWCKQ